jgi:hypothetical protein
MMFSLLKKVLPALGILTLAMGGFIFRLYFWQGQPVAAQVGADELSGWAWSENIGWISFNCEDLGVCGVSDYAVSFNASSGKFSGFAWAETIGWINFGPQSGYPQSPGHEAKLNVNDSQIEGWAQACAVFKGDDSCSGSLDSNAGGWDGWIKLGDAGSDNDWVGNDNSQVWLDNTACELRGWAWGSDVVGWIVFNSKDLAGSAAFAVAAPASACNQGPDKPNNLNLTKDYCAPGGDSWTFTFGWDYSDPESDPQSYYQLQIDNSASFNSPECDTGQQALTVSSKTITLGTAPNSVECAVRAKGLNYATDYRWRIKVWDSNNNESQWSTETASFETPPHAYPQPGFTWDPIEPVAGEEVQFTDETIFGSGSSGQSWSWSWTGDSPNPSSSSAQNPKVIFGDPTVSDGVTTNLTALDDAGSCQTSQSLTVQESLPEFEEKAPQ